MSNSTFRGSGWAFPPTFELANQQLNLVHDEQTINQAIDILLNTRKGDRSVLPAYGSNLNQYIFRNRDSALRGEIINSVRNTLLDYEPRISVIEVEVDFVEYDAQLVNVKIQYTIKTTNTRHNHVFPFSLNEGTSLTVNS